jgi:dipeptide/tripeptide permease
VYDKSVVAGTLPVTGASYALGGVNLFLIALALIAVGVGLYRISPRLGKKEN